MMKSTTQLVDEEYEFLRDKAYLDAERYERETILMQELFEMEYARVELGKVRKRNKKLQYATVRTKLPRFLRVQSHHRRIQAATDIWDRSEPPVRAGVLVRGY